MINKLDETAKISKDITEDLEAIIIDLDKALGYNISAARRVRLSSVELARKLARYRKISVQEGLV